MIENGFARGTGLNTNNVGQLLEIVAPLVMGALGRTQHQEGLDANGLSEFLSGERQAE